MSRHSSIGCVLSHSDSEVRYKRSKIRNILITGFSMWTTVLALFLVVATLTYFFCKKKYSYWSSRGVAVPPYIPFVGHLYYFLFGGYRWEYTDKIYHDNKSNKFWGMYESFSPAFYIKDLDLIRDVLIKDADYFIDRRKIKFSGKAKLFREFLTIVTGEKWKALRSIMSPTFSSGKIKSMFPLIEGKAEELVVKAQNLMDQDSYVEMKNLLGLYTMDVIACCAFGIEASCIQEGNSEFADHANTFVNLSFKTKMKFLIAMFLPKLFEALNLDINESSTKFFEEVVHHTVKVRKESGIRRGDFLDILLEALEEHDKSESNYKYPMTMDTVLAESVLFLLAGFDTTANALAFTTYLLAKNPDCQALLRKELKKIRETDGELNYQNIMEAQYLDACFSETLRLYTLAHVLERVCTRSYKVPESDIVINEGDLVSIPAWSLHHDPEYWEEPSKFQPERFFKENKQNIIPGSYVPFGLGPRNCIGMRFAQMEAKIALAKLFLEFDISLKPGFELKLDSDPGTLRPDKAGVQVVLRKL